MKNRGSTCYLNSLIQILYMTPEFRNGIFSLNGEEVGFENWLKSKTETKVETNSNTARVSDSDMDSFMAMGFNSEQVMIAAKKCGKYATFEDILSVLLGESGLDAVESFPTGSLETIQEEEEPVKKSKNILIQFIKV